MKKEIIWRIGMFVELLWIWLVFGLIAVLGSLFGKDGTQDRF